MSSSNTDRLEETTPLLPNGAQQNGTDNTHNINESIHSGQDDQSSKWASGIDIQKIPVMFRVAPPLFLVTLADNMTYLTIVDLMKKFLCSVWYSIHRPDEVPEDGPIPVEKCQLPGPVAWFSAYMVITNIMLALSGFLVASLVAQYGAMVGRKPILILSLFGFSVALICFTSLLFISNDILAFTLLGIWMITATIFGVPTTMLMINFITIDSSTPENRTTSLSIVFGAVSAGSIPAFLFGGIIEKHAGAKILFLLAIGASLLALLYSTTPLVPETFGNEQREAARLERRERHRQARERSLERWNAETEEIENTNRHNGTTRALGRNGIRHARRAARKTGEAVVTVFDPILRLKPTKKENGKMNARLTILALAHFFYALGTGYLGPAFVAFMSVVLLADPEESGFLLTSYMVFQLVGFTVVFPAIVKYGRILYAKHHGKGGGRSQKDLRIEEQQPLVSERAHDQTHHDSDGQGNYLGDDSTQNVEESQPTQNTNVIGHSNTLDNPHSELALAHFDVYLLRFCYVAACLFFVTLSLARNKVELVLTSAFVIFMAGNHPTLQSIGAASVEPIITGEIIAGLEMIGNTAKTLSPLVIGYIQSKTILTMPIVIWLSMLVCTFLALLLAFFIRDEDRYIPHLSQSTPSSPPLLHDSQHGPPSSPLSPNSDVQRRHEN